MQSNLSTIVSGTLILPNGEEPKIYFETDGALINGKVKVPYKCSILGKHISLEFLEGFESENDIDKIFRAAKHIIDSTILSRVILDGVGFLYTIETCRKHNGEFHLAKPDQAPLEQNISFDTNLLIKLIGLEENLMFAIRDFNQGLIDRENCPVLFYKSIEILAKLLTGKKELESKDWNEFHKKIGTKRDDMKVLEEINEPHRHGNRIPFIREQHFIMMKTTRNFLIKTIEFLLKEKNIDAREQELKQLISKI